MKNVSVKILAAAMSLCMIMSGCSSDASSGRDAKFTAGTYESTKTGHHGNITVSMTFTDSEIESCEVTENTDTNYISEDALNIVCANTVKYQTGNVDTVAGATLSCMAAKQAIADCISQAGGSVRDMDAQPEKEETETETEDYDVVIVGAGASGMTAALAAAENDDGTSSGLNILVVEKLNYCGGSFVVSGAGVFNPSDTELHENGEADIIDEDTFVGYLNYRSKNDFLGLTNEGLQRLVYEGITPAEKLLQKAGIPFTFEGNYCAEPMDTSYEGASNRAFVDILYAGPAYDPMEAEMYEEKGYASVGDIIGPFFSRLFDNYDNITMKLDTCADSLVVDENNAVTGVVVTETDYENNTVSKYTVNAKKVILCTGSPQSNREIMEEYDPDFLSAIEFCGAGQTGDGITMVQDAGLDPVVQGEGGMCYNGVSYQYAMEDGLALNDIGAPVVNKSGERYYAEGITPAYDTGRYTREQEDNTAYIIEDSTSEFLNGNELWYHEGVVEEGENLYDYMVRNGWAVKADTLEELADLIGVDQETFVKTITDFNAAAAGEQEDELGVPSEYMIPVLEAPYYAITTHAYRIESYVSLKTCDGSSRIADSEGNAIENLYGAGTLVVSNIYYDNYFNYDGGLTTGLTLGYVAGTEARDALLK